MLNIRVELIIAFVAIVMGIGVAWFLFGSLTPDDNAEGAASTEQSTTPSGESTMEAIMDDLAQPGELSLSAESSIEAVVEEVVQQSEAGAESPMESVVEKLAQPAESVAESSIRSIVGESAQPADPSVGSLNEDSQEFVDQVQEGLSDSGSEVEDWSADAFLELLEREKTVGAADVTLEDDLKKEILDAAHRDEIKPRKGDPYLSSLMDEASGLSVTAVNISEGSDLVRNSSRRSRPTDSQGSQPTDRFITVEKGDSLSGLADRLYGDPKAYGSIFRANQDILSSPDLLSVGQRLRVPSR